MSSPSNNSSNQLYAPERVILQNCVEVKKDYILGKISEEATVWSHVMLNDSEARSHATHHNIHSKKFETGFSN